MRLPNWMGSRWGLTLLVLASGATGCSESSSVEDDRVELYDEDGVAVIEVRDLWATDWPNLPAISVDTLIAPLAGDDLGLVAPLYAAFLSDGRLLLGDAGTRRVWIDSGDQRWQEGPGPGSGPGELAALGGIWAHDAGFTVHDPGAGDLIHFDEHGRLVERHPVGIDGARHGVGAGTSPWPPTVQHLGRENWLVSVAGVPERAESGLVMRSQFRYTWVSGNPPRREMHIGMGPTQPVFVQGGGGAPIPFASTAFASGAAGNAAIFQGRQPKVELFDEAGDVILSVRWTDLPRPLDESHRGALGAYMRRVAPPEALEAGLEGMIASLNEAIPYPETLPHLGGLRLGGDGAIWLGWPERSGLETPTEPEFLREWRVIHRGATAGQEPRVYKTILPAGTMLLGPAAARSNGGAPGRSGAGNGGDFFLLLRDEMGRQGIGILRLGADSP